MQSNVRDQVVFASPQNMEQREAVGSTCIRKLGIKFPALVDNFQNTVEQAYTGWPDRIYVINTEGRIVYKSRPGPFGFKAGALEEALNGLHLPPKAN